MNKKIAVIGVVILLLGVVLTGIGYTGIMNKSMEDMAEDYNEAEGEYESYDEGDTITITGVITNKRELQGVYVYEMDGVDEAGASFITGNDIADEGDRITVDVEVKVMGIFGFETEVLEGQNYSNPTLMAPITLVGLVILIVGVIVTVIGAIKSEDIEEYEGRAPPQQPGQQPLEQQQPSQQYQQSRQQTPPPSSEEDEGRIDEGFDDEY
ncbi:MAG: hypothetical protein ACOCTN_04065 [Candidatus Natronoplasma sp.]